MFNIQWGCSIYREKNVQDTVGVVNIQEKGVRYSGDVSHTVGVFIIQEKCTRYKSVLGYQLYMFRDETSSN